MKHFSDLQIICLIDFKKDRIHRLGPQNSLIYDLNFNIFFLKCLTSTNYSVKFTDFDAWSNFTSPIIFRYYTGVFYHSYLNTSVKNFKRWLLTESMYLE